MTAKAGVLPPSPSVRRLTVSKARLSLGDLVDRVHRNKEYIILEKGGAPVAGLMDVDEFEDYLELRDPKVREDIRKSYGEYRAGRGRRIEEFIAELKTERRPIARRRRRKA